MLNGEQMQCLVCLLALSVLLGCNMTGTSPGFIHEGIPDVSGEARAPMKNLASYGGYDMDYGGEDTTPEDVREWLSSRDRIFTDGFESGDVGAWTCSVR